MDEKTNKDLFQNTDRKINKKIKLTIIPSIKVISKDKNKFEKKEVMKNRSKLENMSHD